MKPITFEHSNVVFGKDQKGVQPLPAWAQLTPPAEVVSCWELSEEEVEEIVKNRRIFISVQRGVRIRVHEGKDFVIPNLLQPIMPVVRLRDLPSYETIVKTNNNG